jgi:hypothetical protein
MLEKRNYRGLLLRQGGIRGGNKLNRSVQFKKIVNLSGLALLIWLIWMTIRHPTIWFVTIPAVIATIATNALANWRAEHNQPMTTKVKRQVALHEILLWSVSLGGLAVIICLIWMTIRASGVLVRNCTCSLKSDLDFAALHRSQLAAKTGTDR